MIRVLLADDHGLVRDGLGQLLEDDPATQVVILTSSVFQRIGVRARVQAAMWARDHNLG
jgi:DNA-binding NarL/FixJ family response regulator